MKLAFLRAHQYMESLPAGSGDILLTIHDSTVWQMRKGMEEQSRELNRVLENAAQELELIVPIPTDFHKGSNWAEASYGDK
jgi:DNA polymerase I-like protein with 3'-5' exonuclease and polymerase domains